MANLAEIETATKAYADKRGLLILKVELLNTEIEELKRKHMDEIKALAGETANAKSTLETVIDDSRPLFVKPRSIIISGIKVGLQKGKGGLDYEDEATVIRLIRKHVPQLADLLIKTVEKVIKKALGELDVITLKKIGVTVKGTGDEVLIKPVDSDVDKIINAMLKESAAETAELEEAA
jgi:hypothetical protein